MILELPLSTECFTRWSRIRRTLQVSRTNASVLLPAQDADMQCESLIAGILSQDMFENQDVQCRRDRTPESADFEARAWDERGSSSRLVNHSQMRRGGAEL